MYNSECKREIKERQWERGTKTEPEKRNDAKKALNPHTCQIILYHRKIYQETSLLLIAERDREKDKWLKC